MAYHKVDMAEPSTSRLRKAQYLSQFFTSTGGNADVSKLDSIGGDGGDIILKSLLDTFGTLYTIPTTYLLSGGDGAEGGAEGQIVGYNIEIEEFDCLAGSALS